MRAAAAALLLFVLVAPTPAAAQDNGTSNSFGTLDVPAHAPVGDAAAHLTVEARLDPDAYAGAFTLLFAFIPQADALDVELVDVTDGDGNPLPYRVDERTKRSQPRVMIDPPGLPADGHVQLHGLVQADARGRYDLGALVIAFDASYAHHRTPEGEPAQLYGYSFIESEGSPGWFSPPVHGAGNEDRLLWVGVLGLAGLGAGGYAARRRLARGPSKKD